jgi:pilus retraction protein PilT
MNAIFSLLASLTARQASDLLLFEGEPPRIKSEGRIEIFNDQPVSSDEFSEFLNHYFSSELCQKFLQQRVLDVGFSSDNTNRFRLCFYFQKNKRALVARIIPFGDLPLSALNLPTSLQHCFSQKKGLILITGAAGTGKSTTVAAHLNLINETQQKHIITIEDPIEYLHSNKKSLISQREIGLDVKDFTHGLKEALRQAPDVIFIGEMRDFESLSIALSAAMTGHLVVSTMHTSNVAQTLERILHYFPEDQRHQIAMDLSLVLEGVYSQTLVQRANGEGMIPVFEYLRPTPFTRQLIRDQLLDDVSEYIKTSSDDHVKSMNRSLLSLCTRGLIDPPTARQYSPYVTELNLMLEGIESGSERFRIDGPEEIKRPISVKDLLHCALQKNASDIILSSGASPSLRISGRVIPIKTPPLTPGDCQHLIYSFLSSAQRKKLEQTRELDFALSLQDLSCETLQSNYRFRINCFYQRGYLASTIRVIPTTISSPESLNLPPVMLQAIQQKQGLILVTGATGQGKTTTISSLIHRINEERNCHIITIEDPIEIVHKNNKSIIEQREIFSDTLSYSNALKYVLRQSPDVIYLAEMRDLETIRAAITAAETGHLVLATLHTNDATQTLDRITDVFSGDHQKQIRMQLSACLSMVVSQRLVPTKDQKSQVAAFEVMTATHAIRAIIRDGRSHQLASTIETSQKYGMITMDHHLIQLYRTGLISRETLESNIKHSSVLSSL